MPAAANSSPNFYLASKDYSNLEEPRKCWRICPLRTNERNDLLLIRIDPPLFHHDIQWENVIIASKWAGYSVLSINQWPVPVHVALALKPYNVEGFIDQQDIESIAWAELYPTEAEAQQSVKGI